MRGSMQLRPFVSCSLLAVVLCAGGCSGPDEPGPDAPGYDDVAAQLRNCPEGDGPWRSAVRVAERESRADELTALARELSRTCAGRWEPAWTVGRSQEGRSPDPDDVRRAFEESLRRSTQLDDPVGIARSNNQLAWGAYTRGELSGAVDTYRDALAAAQRAERLDLESFIRNNLAGTLIDLGQFDGARTELEHAAAGLTQLGREHAAWGLAFNRAVITLELGDARGALELLQRVHDWAAQHDDSWTVDASAVVAANIHLGLDRVALARAWYARVGSDYEDLAMLAELGLGRAALQDGDPEMARRRFAALAERAGPADHQFGAIVQVVLADAELQGGDHVSARDRLSSLIEGRDEPIAADAAWAAWWLLGRCHQRAGSPVDARAAFERSVALLEEHGGGLDPLSDGLYFLRHRADPYASLAFALASETELSAGARATAHEKIVAVMRSAQARALRGVGGGDASGAAASAELRTIRAALAADEAIVVYLLGQDAGLAMTIRRDGSHAVKVAGREALVEPLERFAAAIRDPGATSAALAASGGALTRGLLDPLEATLRGVTRLYVVPDSELARIPFSALPSPDGASMLGARFEIAMLASVGAPARWSAVPTPVLLAGLPQPPAGPSLPWAGFELSRLQDVWGDARTSATGDGFGLDAFLALPLERFGTIHLATHASASTVDPRRCGVTMSGGDRLGIDRIATLPLDGSLIVLSACSTGEGELVPGQGALSLGWAFMLAGAHGVVASQWTVDDNASARLMIAFHERLRDGVDPVRALAVARRELATAGVPPAHWAPFVIMLRAT